MDIEKFFETLGILIAEKNNVKLKSFEVEKKTNVLFGK